MRALFMLVFYLFLFPFLHGEYQLMAHKVKLQGSWSYAVQSSDVIEAGSDFAGVYTSSLGQILFSVNDKKKTEANGYNWSVWISKSDNLWDNTAIISVQRLSDGIPYDQANVPTTVTGGTSFQQVTNTDQYFFGGYRGSIDIDIQYQLQGVSVVMPAQSYSTTIVYTVTSP